MNTHVFELLFYNTVRLITFIKKLICLNGKKLHVNIILLTEYFVLSDMLFQIT